MMDRRFMVKQYIAVVENAWGTKLMVFQSGDEKYYLFCPLDPDGCQAAGLQFPVRKTDLRKEIRAMLAHGCGNTIL